MSDAETYQRIRTGGGIIDLSDRVILRFSGHDRVRYLNGQVSNDVRKLSPGSAMYACVMTAKGRMSGDVYVTAMPDLLQVDADPILADSLPIRFERYIIADDVTLDDVSGSFGLLHVIGGDETALRSEGIATAVSIRYGLSGVDLTGPIRAIAARFREIADKLPVIDDSMAEIFRIEAGIPRWGYELTEDTIPVEAGLQHTAISYEKGCYIGQEVISRLKSIGHVNRILCGLVPADGKTGLVAGYILYDSETSEKPVGSVTSGAFSFDLDVPVALGYLKRDIKTAGLIVRDANGADVCEAHVHQLPFVS
jgi:folate-binding protein YgfZ